MKYYGCKKEERLVNYMAHRRSNILRISRVFDPSKIYEESYAISESFFVCADMSFFERTTNRATVRNGNDGFLNLLRVF